MLSPRKGECKIFVKIIVSLDFQCFPLSEQGGINSLLLEKELTQNTGPHEPIVQPSKWQFLFSYEYKDNSRTLLFHI